MQDQFEYDHEPEKVHEGLAAETSVDEDLDFELFGDQVSDDDPDEKPSEEQLVVPTVVRQAVRRLHENTGHRSPQRLARALLIAGAPPEAVLAAKQLKCSVCEERRPVKARRPASLPGPRDPGDQVGIDFVDVFDAAGARLHCAPRRRCGDQVPDGGAS